MDKDHPLVSVIVANWNGGGVFKNFLNSLLKLKYKNWEMITVDNGSFDMSWELPEKILNETTKKILIKNEENLGFAEANNQGFEKSSGKYILLLNNDTVISPNFLTELVKKMEEDKEIGVIQPKIYMLDKMGYLDNAGSFFTFIGFLHHRGFLEKDSPELNIEQEVFSVKGACMLIRRELIEEVGLFDKDFFSYFEESDFCWRVWLAGYKVIYYPKVSIRHSVGFTIKRLNVLNINYHYYKNRFCSLLKNLGKFYALLIIPLHMLISIGIVLAFLIRGKPKNSLMIINAISWNLRNLNKTLKKRAIIQKNRKKSDGEIFKRVSVSVNFKKYWKDFKRIEKDILE